jgi:hypothetical protein
MKNCTAPLVLLVVVKCSRNSRSLTPSQSVGRGTVRNAALRKFRCQRKPVPACVMIVLVLS